MKQHTIEITGYITVTGPDDLDVDSIPVKIDAFDCTEDEDSPIEEVNETVVVTRRITHSVEV